jgi:hypothetical protein
MNREAEATSLAIFVSILIWLISLPVIQAQQTGSSHFGAGTQRSFSPTGTGMPAQGTVTSGSSSWSAGKGSFKSAAQPGGIWSDGSYLSAPPGVSHSATQVLAPAPSATAFGAARSGSLSGMKPNNIRGNTAPGMAHLSRSLSSQRSGTTPSGHSSVSRPSGISHPIGGSRGSACSVAYGAGRHKTPDSHDTTSKMTHHTSAWTSTPNSSLKSGLNTRLSGNDTVLQ